MEMESPDAQLLVSKIILRNQDSLEEWLISGLGQGKVQDATMQGGVPEMMWQVRNTGPSVRAPGVESERI